MLFFFFFLPFDRNIAKSFPSILSRGSDMTTIFFWARVSGPGIFASYAFLCRAAKLALASLQPNLRACRAYYKQVFSHHVPTRAESSKKWSACADPFLKEYLFICEKKSLKFFNTPLILKYWFLST